MLEFELMTHEGCIIIKLYNHVLLRKLNMLVRFNDKMCNKLLYTANNKAFVVYDRQQVLFILR